MLKSVKPPAASKRTTTPKPDAPAEVPAALQEAIDAPPPEDKDFLIQSLRNQLARKDAYYSQQIAELEGTLLKSQHAEAKAMRAAKSG